MLLHKEVNKLWDLEKPIIRQPSRLHHLKPIGVGTPHVESLTGYVAQLAEYHRVPLAVLISREITPVVNQIFLKSCTSRGLRALFDRATALNGTGKMVVDFVQALETLTLRDNLRFLTLLIWTEILPSQGLFRDHT